MIEDLSQEQKQLLFDYCIGITTPDESAKAQELISSNNDAARLVNKLKTFFSPLDSAHFQQEECPEELVEKTIAILKSVHSNQSTQPVTEPVKLRELIAAEQAGKASVAAYALRSFGRILAAAAVIFFVVGTYFSVADHMRQQSWQTGCQANLMTIGRGLASYQNENNGQMPMVAMSAGDPWWKLGYRPESNENQSNTRHMYLLVRKDYVKPEVFICPGSKTVKVSDLQKLQANQLRDFPGRQYVSFSFRIRCTDTANNIDMGRTILISDMNPLFEQLPKEFKQMRLQLDDNLKKLNSINHNRRGQNILFNDGSVSFVKTRFAGPEGDDIFTIQNTTVYQGNETPQKPTDDFVAP